MKVIITEDNIYQFDKVVGWKVYQKPVIEQLRVSQSDWTINYTLVNGEEVEVLVKGQTESLVYKNGEQHSSPEYYVLGIPVDEEDYWRAWEEERRNIRLHKAGWCSHIEEI